MRKSSGLQFLTFLFLCQVASAMSGLHGGPKVAIIGGGISGLSCARRLQALGIISTVFDTGKKATGGRCSSRTMRIDGKTIVADHSSQFFTASSERFKKDLESLRSDGSIFEWYGDLVHITDPSVKAVKIPIVKGRLVCKNGMETFSRKMSENLEIKRPVWVRCIAALYILTFAFPACSLHTRILCLLIVF
jgi:predicted NAD/FAD-dependent oxidoreductase